MYAIKPKERPKWYELRKALCRWLVNAARWIEPRSPECWFTDRGEKARKTLKGIDDKPQNQMINYLQARIDYALAQLSFMIDGGEECRGRDSEISQVIRVLEGKTP